MTTATDVRITRSFLSTETIAAGQSTTVSALGTENELNLFGGNRLIEFSYGRGDATRTITGTLLGIDSRRGNWRLRFRRPGDFLDSCEEHPVDAGTQITFVN